MSLAAPNASDRDGDGLSDDDELALGTDPDQADSDGDGLADGEEVALGTDPIQADTDGDGLADGEEVALGTDPMQADSDGDGLSDGDEVSQGSDPLQADADDTDGDGLADADEAIYGTSPTMADTDYDGVNDADEANYWGNNWDVNYDNDDLLNNLLDPDSDNDSYIDGLELHYGSNPADPNSTPALTDIIAISNLQVNHAWQQVTFTVPFLDPIVIAKPLSKNENDPAVVRIRNVTPHGFDIRIQEWGYLDGAHTTETVSYMVMERGSFVLDNGTANGIRVEAGSFDTDQTSFASMLFNQPFNVAPVILAAVTSTNEADAVVVRMKNISNTTFQYRLQEQESNPKAHAMETVAYIAWEPSVETIDGLTFEVNATPKAVKHQLYPIEFAAPFTESPVFIADMQTVYGGDTANLRWSNKELTRINILVSEEQSKDNETNHVSEVVGYIVIH